MSEPIPTPWGADDVLRVQLAEARSLGFLGRAPLEDHLANGLDFVEAIVARVGQAPERIVDLGSGGGVPGLIIARSLPASSCVLIDRGARRCAFLRHAIRSLELDERVVVVEAEAEQLARRQEFAGTAQVVTARSFGPPAVTAESGARFLRSEGWLVVSEPPNGDGSRWPSEALEPLGLGSVLVHHGRATTLACLQRRGSVDARYPRRSSTARKRPLF